MSWISCAVKMPEALFENPDCSREVLVRGDFGADVTRLWYGVDGQPLHWGKHFQESVALNMFDQWMDLPE